MPLEYRPEIDGLRAVAILPVVLFHAGVSYFSGGFVGVDVFFVISGYLITSIIVTERREGRFSYCAFYQRRIRRIFPALAVMMAIRFPIALVVLEPAAMQEFSGGLAASVAFISNIYFLRVSGYFATAAEFKPLLHNWSLSVEEQYYLLFPAAVLLTWRMGPKVQATLFGAVAILSLGLAEYWVQAGDTERAFFLLQSRIWELLLGGLASYVLLSDAGQRMVHDGRCRHAGLLGIALIVLSVFGFNADTPFPGVSALFPCLGALLVILFAAQDNLAGQLLGLRPVVSLGLVSYSLYLWHQPLLAFTRIATGSDNVWLMLAVCAASMPVAILSWRFVERPARKVTFPSLRLFGSAAAAMALLGGLGLAGWATGGFGELYARYRLDAKTRLSYDRHMPQTIRGDTIDDGCNFHAGQPLPKFDALFDSCFAKYGKAIVIIGDSHASNIFRALQGSGRYPFLVGFQKGGCRPFNPKPTCPFDSTPAFLQRHVGQISQLVFHVSGSPFIVDQNGRSDSNAAFEPVSAAQFARDDIRKTVDYVASLARGIDVIWLGPFAEARVNLSDPENFSPERLHFNPVSLDLFRKLDQLLKSETAHHRGFRYVSLIDALRFDKSSLLVGDCLTFHDADHLSSCGEVLFAPSIASSIAPRGAP